MDLLYAEDPDGTVIPIRMGEGHHLEAFAHTFRRAYRHFPFAPYSQTAKLFIAPVDMTSVEPVPDEV